MENPFRLVSTGFRQVSSIWQGLLQLIIILRAAITICNELNVHWNTEEVSWLEYTLIPQVKGDLCSSFVVVIGISLVLLYGISFFDCLYWLIDARRFILENRFQNIFIIIAVVVCSINASYFYSFVSETWTQSLNSVFQALHIVPTIIVVYYTFSIGLVLCFLNSSQLPIEFRIDIRKHQGANIVLAVYALTNCLVSLTSGTNTSTMSMSVTLELICRGYFLYKLMEKLQAPLLQHHPRPQPRPEEEFSDSDNSYPGFGDRFGNPIACLEDMHWYLEEDSYFGFGDQFEYPIVCWDDIQDQNHCNVTIYISQDQLVYHNVQFRIKT